MDAARSALRLGAEEVTIVYRRSEKEMPARIEEIENAKEEGINFKLLTAPVKFLADKSSYIRSIICIKMELGAPDESGRRRPTPIKDSEFVLESDTVIIAIGQTPHPLLIQATPGLKTAKHGNIIVNPETMQTNFEGVFAGGDIVTGADTVISAMGAGKKAALAIHNYIQAKKK
jgi:glutamate synthase (NADPH/NADH) small chain